MIRARSGGGIFTSETLFCHCLSYMSWEERARALFFSVKQSHRRTFFFLDFGTRCDSTRNYEKKGKQNANRDARLVCTRTRRSFRRVTRERGISRHAFSLT